MQAELQHRKKLRAAWWWPLWRASSEHLIRIWEAFYWLRIYWACWQLSVFSFCGGYWCGLHCFQSSITVSPGYLCSWEWDSHTAKWHWDQIQGNIWYKRGLDWHLLLEQKYPNLRRCAFNLTALFGSTCLCEAAFSHMKIIKSKYWSTMTDDHLVACLRLATSSYCPDYEKLASSSQCQRSH